jgi:fimbrial chaperone protein
MTILRALCHVPLLLGLTMVPHGALQAGEFAINPLRIALDRTTRASEVAVRNDDAVPLRMQVQAMGWSQDGEGRDRYEPAEGLLYFPRVLEIPPGESRIVRVGARAAPVSREEAYRLFLEELPPATPAAEVPGASLRVFLRVGVAVFVGPLSRSSGAETTELRIDAQSARWVIRNTGNVHVRADRIELAGFGHDGTRLFSREFPDRYLLAGATRTLRHDLAPGTCAQLARVEATLQAEGVDLARKMDVYPGSCG